MIIWWSTKHYKDLGISDVGVKVSLTAKIKAHSEYKGMKQTTISHGKVKEV